MKYLKYLFLLAALGAAAGFYMYNKPVKSTDNRSADVSIKADQLFVEFETNEATANQKYLDKVIAVEGVVNSIASEDGLDIVILKTSSEMFGIVCKMEKNHKLVNSVKKGDHITLKGICTGMLMDVVMIRCVINEG